MVEIFNDRVDFGSLSWVKVDAEDQVGGINEGGSVKPITLGPGRPAVEPGTSTRMI
jgi:hypothetical protein